MSVLDDETAQIVEHEVLEILEKQKKAEERRFLESLKKIEIEFPLTVRDFSAKVQAKVSEILKKLMEKGKVLNINQNIDKELAVSIGKEFGYLVEEKKLKEELLSQVELKEEKLRKRPPVVTFMGHIDHGKTSLLDRIRHSRLAEKEAGGITQHMGAYQVEVSGQKITFIDTPGHHTFTMMRARGAQVTDIVVLVVAADEGVMPQTQEALNHARQADVPIIVAINKIDKPDSDVDKTKRQLSQIGLTPEEWGGDTLCVSVSAKTGQGVDELLEMIILQAEMMDLKADYDRPALGVVLESRLTKEKGSLSTFIVQHGILKRGDYIVAGRFWGKIRAMWDDLGNTLQEVGPSSPAEVWGLDGCPQAGDKFFVVPNEDTAKEIVERRREEKQVLLKRPVDLKELLKRTGQDESKQLKVILKADTFGTLEAVSSAIRNMVPKEVRMDIIHQGVGAINSSDIVLAEASQALVVGFNVVLDNQAKEQARLKGIEVRTYRIIYELLDDIKQALEGLVGPAFKRIFLGRLRVKKVFKLSKAGTVAGCFVEQGIARRGSEAELIRDGKIVFKGKVQGLKRFKDDVREVAQGYECGVSLGFEDIKDGDFIDIYTQEEVKS